MTTNTSDLEQLKVFLQRGKLTQANAILSEVEKTVSPSELAGLFVIKCRLAYYEGNYSLAVEHASEALKLPSDGLNLTIAHQLRAVSLFEMGHFKETLFDVEKTLALCRLYSFSNLSFFAKALEIRVIARSKSLNLGRSKLNDL